MSDHTDPAGSADPASSLHGAGSAARATAAASARLFDRLLDPAGPPFALLRRRTPGRDHDTVEVLTGPVHEAGSLAELPVGERPALALVPFRQLRERGFEVTDDGTPLAVLVAAETYELPVAEALELLPARPVRVTEHGFDLSDAQYAETVRRVVAEEIGRGVGANFVVRRTWTGRIDGFGRADALALFRRLLAGERGAYWTFVVHTGDRVLVGASPEVHVRMTGGRGPGGAAGTVVMNPISGTYRYPPGGPDLAGLLEFLADRKETDELSMVVDEELKMMCAVGDLGGVVVGPRLREMSQLAHTEYELRGRSSLDVREVLRETMFAATVTGSPVRNACRVISRYEHGGRGYYAGALALLSTDAEGAQTLDSPILIRTADIAARGRARGELRVGVGATLVRHSDPAGEVAETHAKAAGVLAALGVRPGRPAGEAARPRLADAPGVRAALDARRAELAPFWLRMRQPPAEVSGHALVVDAEDAFTAMLAHLLRATGLGVSVVPYDAPGLRAAAVAHRGPVVLGPGPGDPGDPGDPKMRLLRGLAGELLAERAGAAAGRPVIGVCLGHELLAAELGLPLVRKREPFQGAQLAVELFGRRQTVGFYNSFTARCDDRAAGRLAGRGVAVSRDPATGEVHALRGPGFAGVQFHPESVLTLDGAGIVRDLLDRCGHRPAPVTARHDGG
ncbi:anthranilate synthase family protein [Streptomyces sp. LP05-1]|uniref:anthranilate synthase n=1 Tax=Streptomyces pyxinae TaxID=2970734 RepID=A0ABT2CG25_9ACTN|nr:anthranilate synthase family protein [Streptomyces sp. LP05-1]MCS0636369.1 anthranilate synthase family protein [Streptomyces sp. LP05-1]